MSNPTNIVPPLAPLPTTLQCITNPELGLPDYVCLHVETIGDRWAQP